MPERARRPTPVRRPARPRRGWRRPLAWAALTLSALAPTAAASTPVTEAVLANGLRVLVVEEHKAPVVTVQVWYRVGSRHEVMGKAGLSHMLEHMMFKGTARHPKGTFSRTIRKNGGHDNAFTGQDYTAYFENLAADRVELALELEADRMQGLLLDETEFRLEREVVKEERRLRIEDNPQAYLVESLYAHAFLQHPYHWPVIGWFHDLNTMSLDDLRSHYDTYYSPNNATLVVAGDVQAETLLPVIKRFFEPIPRGPDPPAVKITEPGQRGERRFIVKRDAQLPFLMMGFRAPNYEHEDAYPLAVLESILSDGKSSRLYRSLVYDDGLALAAGSGYEILQADPDLFYFYVVLKPNVSVARAEESVLAQIRAIQAEPPTARELARAKNQVEASWIFGQDSVFRQAMLLGQAETVGAGWRHVHQFVDRIRQVSAEDVRRVASRYLVEDRRTVGMLIPQPPTRNAASETDDDAPRS